MTRANPLTRYVLASLVAACGSSAEPADPDTPPVSEAATEEEILAYRGLIEQVDASALAYETSMVAPALTVEGCTAAQRRYDREARPAIGRMLGLAHEMDGFMDSHGGGFFSDLSCTARGMIDELDDHNHIACMWPDIERDRSEAFRHLGVMLAYIDHVEQRTDEMLAGMAGYGWHWGPLAGCQ